MKRSVVLPAVYVLLSVLLVPNARGAAESQADLQTLFDGGHYQQLLPELNRAIALRGSAAAGYDHYKLLILKGETQLRLPSGKSATESFKAAALVAPTPDDAAIARATALLINRSTNGKFLPKKTASTPKPAAMPIVKASDRTQAFEALFTELMDTAKPDLDRAEQITTLPPLIEIAHRVGDIRGVEIASTGNDDRSKEALKPIAEHAEKLMTDALKVLDTDMTNIDKAAAKRLKQFRGKSATLKQESLTPDAVDQLENLAGQAKQIAATAQQLQPAFGDAGDFEAVKSAAKQTTDQANEILKKYDHAAMRE
jgi:hypothetical protein